MIHKLASAAFSIWSVKYYDKTNSRYVWFDDTSTKYILSAIIGVPVAVDGGDNLYPLGYSYNGQPVYASPVTGYQYLWYDAAGNQWVINDVLGFGIREVDAGVGASPRYTGDSWFSLAGSSITGTYVARGKLKQTTPTATHAAALGVVEGWESVTLAGEYAAVSGSSVAGTKWVGWRVLNDGTNDYLENLDQTNAAASFSSTSLSIWYDTSKWIISSAIGSKPATGYWQGSSLIGSYSLVWTPPEPPTDAPTPSSYAITQKEYRELTGPDQVSVDQDLAQVCVWL